MTTPTPTCSAGHTVQWSAWCSVVQCRVQCSSTAVLALAIYCAPPTAPFPMATASLGEGGKEWWDITLPFNHTLSFDEENMTRSDMAGPCT